MDLYRFFYGFGSGLLVLPFWFWPFGFSFGLLACFALAGRSQKQSAGRNPGRQAW